MAKKRTLTDKSRTILVRFHEIREWVERKELDITYVSTEWQFADGMTKGLTPDKHNKLFKHFVRPAVKF